MFFAHEITAVEELGNEHPQLNGQLRESIGVVDISIGVVDVGVVDVGVAGVGVAFGHVSGVVSCMDLQHGFHRTLESADVPKVPHWVPVHDIRLEQLAQYAANLW